MDRRSFALLLVLAFLTFPALAGFALADEHEGTSPDGGDEPTAGDGPADADGENADGGAQDGVTNANEPDEAPLAPGTVVHEGVRITAFATVSGGAAPALNLTRGASGTFTIALVALENVTHEASVTLAPPTGINVTTPLSVNVTPFTNATPSTASFNFTVAGDAPAGDVSLAYVVVFERPESLDNETVQQSYTYAGEYVVTIAPAVVPPIPPTPVDWPLIVGAGVLVLAAGAGAYALKRRRDRPKIQPRSRVLQEMKMEERVEKLEKKGPASVEAQREIQEIREAVRAQEKVREASREVKILEAKRDDVLKQMNLLKKRREMGGLTEHQFNKMMEKKAVALEEAERQLAEMQAGEDADSGVSR